MKFIIHRGSQEIGGSCVEFFTGSARIVVDLGMPLVSPKDKKKKLDTKGFDKKSARELWDMDILPRVHGLYKGLDGSGPAVDAVLLSHPHQDHYGLIRHIHPSIPVYLSDGAKRLIDASDIFLPLKANLKTCEIIGDRKPFSVKDFKVVPYTVDHSGYGSMSFLIEANGKRVFYSGDFRAHGRKGKLFKKFLRMCPTHIDQLLMEGTTLGRSNQKAITEDDVMEKIIKTGKKYKGLKLVQASAQNIDRMVSFYKAVRHLRGIFVLDLYSAYVLDAVGINTIPRAGWPGIKVLYTKYITQKIKRSNMSHLITRYRPYEITPNQIMRNAGKVFIMYRNSLIEDIEKIGNFDDAVFIYSQYDGYRKDDSFRKTYDFLNKHKIPLKPIHTSGHADFNTLKGFVQALKPKVLSPIHTFSPERYSELWPVVEILKDDTECEVICV